MLLEFIYKNGLYMCGTVSEVRLRIAEHSSRYITLKQLLDDKKPN